jgi:hypothetical protein
MYTSRASGGTVFHPFESIAVQFYKIYTKVTKFWVVVEAMGREEYNYDVGVADEGGKRYRGVVKMWIGGP